MPVKNLGEYSVFYLVVDCADQVTFIECAYEVMKLVDEVDNNADLYVHPIPLVSDKRSGGKIYILSRKVPKEETNKTLQEKMEDFGKIIEPTIQELATLFLERERRAGVRAGILNGSPHSYLMEKNGQIQLIPVRKERDPSNLKFSRKKRRRK